jgi:hypothetical protein
MAQKRKDPLVSHDVKQCHLQGGLWKRKIMKKTGKKKVRKGPHLGGYHKGSYTAIPPAEGWLGGPDPEKNGWKPRKKG